MSTEFVYEIPKIPLLLTVASFLFILNIAESLASTFLNAGLIGSIVVGIVYGPEAANILPMDAQETFLVVGYIGLLLIVFEAGLTTDMTVLYKNLFLSATAALVGIIVPIGLSMLLLGVGYEYTVLQGFAAGAALCSTSLGTTLSLLSPKMKQTRTGVVVISAALFDDIVGLVIASVIGELSSSSNSLSWESVVRPILVSIAFIVVTYIAARLLPLVPGIKHHVLQRSKVQLFALVSTLSGYVAGAKYAGTSELLGAYLAGTSLLHIFPSPNLASPDEIKPEVALPADPPPMLAFSRYLLPLLQVLLSPVFFASIGAALPMSSLGSVNGSSRVVWRGIVYSVLMFVAKMCVGGVLFIWPDPENEIGWFGRKKPADVASIEEIGSSERTVLLLSRTRAAVLLGVAMVARGEIALIVAQLGRPLLDEGGGEAYAVVIWAILINTVGGAVGVGFLLRTKT